MLEIRKRGLNRFWRLAEKGEILKTYREVGQQQTGKVLIGGAFAFKNAVQQSTKLALDKILQRLILDINEQ